MLSKNVIIVFAILFITVGFLEKMSGQRKLGNKAKIAVIKKKKMIVQKAKSKSIRPVSKKPVQQSINVKESSIKRNQIEKSGEEDVVPWKQLQENWHEILKNAWFHYNPEEGEELYQEYVKSNEEFAVSFAKLQMEIRDLYTIDPQTNQVEFKDKQKYMTLKKISMLHLDQHRQKMKDLIGTNYPELRKVYREYVNSIQAFHNEDGTIGVDINFEN